MPAQLRRFFAANKSAAFNQFAYGCNLVDLDGNLNTNGSAVPLYLQIFDKATAPSAADVPVASFMLPTAAPINLPSLFQTIGPLNLVNGLGFGISTTKGTYTAATANYDLFGDIEEGTQSIDGISGLSTVSISAADAGMNIWTRAQSPKRLFSLTVTNGEGANMYVCLGTSPTGDITAPADGTRILQVLPGGVLANGASRTYNFGTDGLTDPRFWKSSTAAFVFLSSTVPTSTAGTGLASSFTAYIKS